VLADRYRLVESLGAGGMSVVWRAYDEVLGRQVAVKVLNADFALSSVARARIRAEAQAVARLSHPHITNVYDYGESVERDGTRVPFVVMELLGGPTLSALLARGPLPWQHALVIGAEVAAALAAAHARGVVHRDVKPGNVMLTTDGAKVVDFGIAAVVGEHADDAPDGQLLGTPAYLAPERLAGQPVTPATDVYAVGLLLYRTLTGRLPWRADTTTQMLSAHCYAEPDPLPPIDGMPDEIIELCRRCLAKAPADRPATAELARTLATAAGIAVPVRVSGASESAPADEHSAPSTGASLASLASGLGLETAILPGAIGNDTGTTTRPARWSRPWSTRVAVAAAALVAAAVLLSTWAMAPAHEPTAMAAAGRAGGAGGGSGAVAGLAPASAACQVRYATRRDAAGTFDVDLTVTNTGTRPVPAWTLEFQFPADQRVVTATGAGWAQAGRVVTLRSAADLAPGAAAALSFTGAYQGLNPLPTGFALNGTGCDTQLVGLSSTAATSTGGSGGGGEGRGPREDRKPPKRR
jgi:eukaryotic-like serine/threonine-protein kinase